MTKSRDNKQAIRAYMRTHGVNYTTAKRELAAQAETRAARTAELRELLSGAVHIEGATRAHAGPLDPTANATLDVDLTGRCVCAPDEQHAGHRDDCPERLKAFPPRTADEAAGIVHPPVTLDMTRAPFAERVRHPHIHDLDGHCAKNRNGNFCPPPTARVAIGVDPDPNYVHSVVHTLNGPALTGGLGTGEPVTPSDADHLRTSAHATTTSHAAPQPGQFCQTHFSWLCQAGQGKCGPNTSDPLPDGATVRLWQQTALDPHTGERVPAVVTQVRYPADETGRSKVTTHTELNARLADPDTTPSRRDHLKAALATGNQDTLNAHLRAHAPGPDIDDLHAALEQLASLGLELREHTDDPDSPVTHEMLRHAILATTTHGTRWGGGHGYPTAADVCRSYLLGIEVTTSKDTPEVDGQYRVHPEDLAGVLEAVADDDAILDEAAHGTAATPDDIAEELLILANDLCKPATTPGLPPSTGDEAHYLLVTEGAHHRTRDYTIDCTTPTTGRGSCEGWEECPQCTFLGTDAWDAILDTGTAHGIEHIMLTNGPGIATGRCALQAFPEAWEESDAILNLPPGRYAINSKWEDEYCTLTLRTH